MMQDQLIQPEILSFSLNVLLYIFWPICHPKGKMKANEITILFVCLSSLSASNPIGRSFMKFGREIMSSKVT